MGGGGREGVGVVENDVSRPTGVRSDGVHRENNRNIGKNLELAMTIEDLLDIR